MSIFEAIRNRLAAVRSRTAATASSPYWKAAEALAAGEEPRVRDEQLLESMRELRKDEADLETDAQLLAELRAAEVVALGATSTRESVAKLNRQAHSLCAEADQLEATARSRRAEAERLRHSATAAERSAEDAERSAARIKRQLAGRGHQVYRGQVAAIDEQQARETAIGTIEDKLRVARADLANEERALQEQQQRRRPDRLDEQAANDEIDLGVAESLSIRREARDRCADRVRQIEQQLAQLKGTASPAADAEPAVQA